MFIYIASSKSNITVLPAALAPVGHYCYIDYGSANTADHLFLARRFVASGCLQQKACFACLLAWLAWLACFVAAWLLRSAL